MPQQRVPSSQPSLKEIARRVSPDQEASAQAVRGRLDTVRPVAVSTPPPPPPPSASTHKLRELAQLCEELESRKQRDQNHDPDSTAVDEARPTGAILPMIAAAAIGVGVIVFAIATTVKSRPPASPSPGPSVAVALAPSQESPVPTAPDTAEHAAYPSSDALDPSLLPPARFDIVRALGPSSQHADDSTGSNDPGLDAGVAVAEDAATSLANGVSSSEGDAAVADAAPQSDATSASMPTEAGVDLAADAESVPETPSPVRIQAALGPVRDAARACVAGLDGASRVSITLGPSGEVTSISVGFPAAGTPAEGCIQSALGGIRVPPFRKPSFTVGLTLKP